jgi:hypothetical protein
MSEQKQVNFTIVPDESGDKSRTYSNLCQISHTPFDFTLTFCEVMPPTDQDLREGSPERIMRAPVRARIVVPVQFIPTLVAALNEHMRVYSESYPNPLAVKGPVH